MIEKIIVRNFRLLKEFSIDLEDSLSLVIGKNNVDKTSLLHMLDQFLGVKGEAKRNLYVTEYYITQKELLHFQ